MNYHNITCPDMNNGSGLRVVLWISGCKHHCDGCQNPQTWDANSGIMFDDDAFNELIDDLSNDYISGITLSGGDPLNETNLNDVLYLCQYIKQRHPTKTIWLYTGYTWEQIFNNTDANKIRSSIVTLCDVVVDGKFIKELADTNYHWAGSRNQRVIDIQSSLKKGEIQLVN